jgi:hypothetical protein
MVLQFYPQAENSHTSQAKACWRKACMVTLTHADHRGNLNKVMQLTQQRPL